jgi:hypothetical protein
VVKRKRRKRRSFATMHSQPDGIRRLSGIRGNTDMLRQRQPVPRMRAVALANLAHVPTRDTNSRSNGTGRNIREQRLDLLREHFARKPGWLLRCVPFRACPSVALVHESISSSRMQSRCTDVSRIDAKEVLSPYARKCSPPKVILPGCECSEDFAHTKRALCLEDNAE